MPPRELRILVIDADPSAAEVVSVSLPASPGRAYEVASAANIEQVRSALRTQAHDLALLSDPLGPDDAAELLGKLRHRDASLPVLAVSAAGGETQAVKLFRAGADDYLRRDELSPATLAAALDRLAPRIERGRTARREAIKFRDGLAELTPREREVMHLVVGGLTTRQIAVKLNRSEATIKIHRSQVMRKIGANTPADLARLVLTHRDLARR
jgi:DNA-binding NarL/FixJ family response regulator